MKSKACTRSVGRPIGYRPEMCDQIIAAMSAGLSLDAAAAEVGISPRSAYQWQRDIPEFSQAIEMGRARALLVWERRALAVAHGEGGNAQIISLALRNRSRSAAGWHDSARLEHSGPEGAPMQIAAQAAVLDTRALTAEQREVLRAALLAAKGEREG